MEYLSWLPVSVFPGTTSIKTAGAPYFTHPPMFCGISVAPGTTYTEPTGFLKFNPSSFGSCCPMSYWSYWSSLVYPHYGGDAVAPATTDFTWAPLFSTPNFVVFFFTVRATKPVTLLEHLSSPTSFRWVRVALIGTTELTELLQFCGVSVFLIFLTSKHHCS